MNELFGIENFNIISDDENYYFFRSLEPGDIQDIEKEIITNNNGYTRLRTDRERWEEEHVGEKPMWNSESKVSLEEMFNHIKMHYSLQTNCISLSSNANITRTYGEMFSEKYVIIKVPKKEMGEKVFHAGQYMLEEIERRVQDTIETMEISENIRDDIKKIDEATTSDEIKDIIKTRYKSETELDVSKAGLRHGITYKSPHKRISSYQSLNEEQILEKNKIIAKLTILEQKAKMSPLMKWSKNNNLLIQTVGNAFASSEQIYYGEIDGKKVQDVSKELLDMFGLLQQVEGKYENEVSDLKRELIQFAYSEQSLEFNETSYINRTDKLKENISIEEMYELTEGKVEYGMANSIVNKIFYLSKSQLQARGLAQKLREITNENPRYEEVIKYIEENGFEIEPNITTRQSNKGYRISEAVSLDFNANEVELIEQIKTLTDEEQIEILENGGLSNVKDIMSNNFSNLQSQEKISKERYYAEAVLSMYDWSQIGIESFTVEEKNNLIQKMQDEHCFELYQMLKEQDIDKSQLPKILLNIITRKDDFEITENDTEQSIKEKRLEQYAKLIENGIKNYNQELSIARIEGLLGYYDIQNTDIKLRPYQQRAVDKANEIFENNKFASVILPTGAGKSFVAISQLMEHKDEEMLYLAPQNEILEQMKDYIIKYVHGMTNTIGKSKDEIIAEVFPNMKFSTYSNLISKGGQELIDKEYDFIVLDELHRTGAKEWGDKLNQLIDNQTEKVKVLGITATPRRDVDGLNMAKKMAERLGYTNKEATNGKHIAINIDLNNAIKMGLVVNPKLISCAYSLKSEGKLDKLKESIDKIENVVERNEKLEEYENLRKNIENAEGIAEILQANVKQGGKYIVFLPVGNRTEDEDGNMIAERNSTKKIQDYENKIVEYFKGSNITPNFHSMLGEYLDKENQRRLEEFKNTNTNDTEFMLVMNKANEGLHIDNLDGIIWLRPMEKNSRILYLQQLGRIIYSEDPDNPTKDEDRPVVIDLVNNTLNVDWDNQFKEQEDLELLNIVVDWTERHDKILPDINSTDSEEVGYAKVLKEIQNKYKEYLENDFEGLNKKQIREVKKIINLGALMDLWQIELPKKEIISKSEDNEEQKYSIYNSMPFKLTGIENDFINLEKETSELKKLSAVGIFIVELKKLKEIGVDITKMGTLDTIEDLAKKSKIGKEKIEEIGLNPNEKIGNKKCSIAMSYRGGNTSYIPPTEEEKQELLSLGISLEKMESNRTQNFIDTLKNLKAISVDITQLISKDTIESLAEKSGIDRKQLEDLGFDPNENIGKTKSHIIQTYRGKERGKDITEEEKQELLNLGIDLDKKEDSRIQNFIKTMKSLQSINIDTTKIASKDTIETLAKKSGINREKIEEIGLNPGEKIGNKKNNIARSYRTKTGTVPTREELDELQKLGISLEKVERNITQELIETLKKMQSINIDVSKMVYGDTIETLAKKSGISRKKIEKIGLDPDKNISNTKGTIRDSYMKGKGNVPTQEEIKELQNLGISLEKVEKNRVQEFIETIEILKSIEVDISKIAKADTIESLAKKSGIDRKQLEDLGLNLDEKIGNKKSNIARSYRTKTGTFPTEEELEKLKELGISLEKKDRNIAREFIETIKILQSIKVDISKMTNADTIESLAKKSGISREKIEKFGLDPEKNIGITRSHIAGTYRGKELGKSLTAEEAKEIFELGINLNNRARVSKRTGKEIAEATISSIKNIELADKEDKVLKELAEKTKEGGIILNE